MLVFLNLVSARSSRSTAETCLFAAISKVFSATVLLVIYAILWFWHVSNIGSDALLSMILLIRHLFGHSLVCNIFVLLVLQVRPLPIDHCLVDILVIFLQLSFGETFTKRY